MTENRAALDRLAPGAIALVQPVAERLFFVHTGKGGNDNSHLLMLFID